MSETAVLSAPAVDLLTADVCIVAIECDDISMLSVTPRGVMDEGGKSGRSFCQFLRWLDRCSFDQRPIVVLWECVQALASTRSSVSEKSTEIVASQMQERGYMSSFQEMDALSFGIPQSRGRAYGISAKLQGLGEVGRGKTASLVAAAWETTRKFHLSCREPLHDLWSKFGAVESADISSSDRKRKAGKKKDKELCKWPEQHQEFLKKEELQTTLSLPQVKWARQAFAALRLPEREVEASTLAFAKLRKMLQEDTAA